MHLLVCNAAAIAMVDATNCTEYALYSAVQQASAAQLSVTQQHCVVLHI